MLTLISDTKEKAAAQRKLEQILKSKLHEEGKTRIPEVKQAFPLYIHNTNDNCKMSFATTLITKKGTTRRHCNEFGIYDPKTSTYRPIVEINIPTENNHGGIAGFFAADSRIDGIILMHSGGLGGGRKGINREKFRLWMSEKDYPSLSGVSKNGGIREGFQVSFLEDPGLPDRIWDFVKHVYEFKKAAGVEGDFATKKVQS